MIDTNTQIQCNHVQMANTVLSSSLQAYRMASMPWSMPAARSSPTCCWDDYATAYRARRQHE